MSWQWVDDGIQDELPLTEEEILLRDIYNQIDYEEKHNFFKGKNYRNYIHFTMVTSKILNKKIKITYAYDEITDLETGECIGYSCSTHIKDKEAKTRLQMKLEAIQ